MTFRTYSLVIGTIAVTAFVTGCAAMPDQMQQASYPSKECKIVLIDSASKEIRAYNSDMHRQKDEANTATEQAYAVGQVGKAQVLNPRFRMGHNEPNTIAQARNDC